MQSLPVRGPLVKLQSEGYQSKVPIRGLSKMSDNHPVNLLMQVKVHEPFDDQRPLQLQGRFFSTGID